MAEYVVMPKEDYEAACNSIRGKTGKTDLIKSGNLSAEIDSIQTGGSGGGSAEGCVTVTFMNGNVELFSRPVYIGDDCPDPITQGRFDTPTKESTAQYNYTYYGWGASDGGAADANILKNITEDKTVYAIFTATVRTYTITFYDEDGTTVLATKQVPYGTVPSYTPTKSGKAFDKWTPTLVPVTGNASYTASWVSALGSGSCGENATWLLGADGVLTISGTGAVTDYSMTMVSSKIVTTAPWQPHNSKITAFVVKDGITSVGNYVLYKHTSLISVTIADSVTRIGEYAFNGCTALTGVAIGNGVESIGRYAFSGCKGLTDIDIPARVNRLNDSTFRGCSGLTTITIPDSVTYIGDGAFSGCSGATSASIPDSVTYIGSSAFNNCTSLNYNEYDNATYLGNDENPYVLLVKANSYSITSCLIHPNTKIIYGKAFWEGANRECKNLTEIAIPDGVKQIGVDAFRSSGLTSITIPNSVLIIGGSSFSGCTGLTSVTFGNSVIEIGAYSFNECTHLTSITIPASVTSIREAAFVVCSALTSATFENTSGWAADSTTLSETDLADTATAATYLVNTYAYRDWTRT